MEAEQDWCGETLEPVEHSEWALPIVAVVKLDKDNVWICRN